MTRQLFDMRAQVVGPVLARVFLTPDNGYANGFKHLIEPSFSIQRTFPYFDDTQSSRVVKNDYAVDYLVGGVTTVRYGITNRLLARRPTPGAAPGTPGALGVAREILSVEIGQSYYTDARAQRGDTQYESGRGMVETGGTFSPLQLTAISRPTDATSGQFRAEFDSKYRSLRSISASGTIQRGSLLQFTSGWRKQFAIEGHPDFTANRSYHFLDTATTIRTADNGVGGTYSPDRIFHLAGAASVAASWRNAVPYLQINVRGTQYLLEAVARANRRCRVLVVTSAQIYGMSDDAIDEDAVLLPQSPYGLSKLAQNRPALSVADADRLDIMVARPFNHIGPGQTAEFAVSSFARQIARIERGLEPPVIAVGNLETRRDMTDVRDVADAYVRIMDGGRAGLAYNVCSGRVWRMRDLLEELLALSTVAMTVDTDPSRFRPIDVPVVQGDPTRLVTELGWTPRIACEQTLRGTLDGWRAEVAREVTHG